MSKTTFLDIVSIVSQYVQLTREGKRHYSGQCPFCASEGNSLFISVDNQYWSCLTCGADGDRYDFVARSENISRAQAILLIGHHANSGEPFPHARFKPEPPAVTVAPAAPGQSEVPPGPSAATTETPKAAAAATVGESEKGLLAPFGSFRNIIPSYQGAAILDDKSKMIVYDSDYPASAELAGIGETLAPILVDAGSMLSKWGMNTALPVTLTLASEGVAILVHKSDHADELMLLVVRLADPADLPVARRLVATASSRRA